MPDVRAAGVGLVPASRTRCKRDPVAAVKLRRGIPLWPALTRTKITRRDYQGQAYCLHCGTTEDLTIQHRYRKGAGGSNAAERPSNGVMLCWTLNTQMEQNATVAALALEYGWKLTGADDPTEAAVYDAVTGLWWLLSDQWTRTETNDPRKG